MFGALALWVLAPSGSIVFVYPDDAYRPPLVQPVLPVSMTFVIAFLSRFVFGSGFFCPVGNFTFQPLTPDPVCSSSAALISRRSSACLASDMPGLFPTLQRPSARVAESPSPRTGRPAQRH